MPNENTYPPLYHLLLGLFPVRLRSYAERFSGAAFDTLSLVVVYAYTRALQDAGVVNDSQHIPLLVVTFFCFSPALLRIGIGPRAFDGSPRVLGQLLYLIHICSFHVWTHTGSVWLVCLSVGAGALLILTAKFANQVFVFFGICFTVIYPPYAGVAGAACLLPTAVSMGHAARVIRGQFRHSLFYVRYLQKVFLHPQSRTFGRYMYDAAAHCYLLLTGGRVWNAVKWYFTERNTLHVAITAQPFLLAACWYIYTNGGSPFMTTWIGSALVAFLITSCRWLAFLGEPERYLEFATAPTVIMSAVLFTGLPTWSLLVVLCYCVTSTVCSVLNYVIDHLLAERQHNQVVAACDMLNNLPQGIVLPIGSIKWAVLLKTRHHVLAPGCNLDERVQSVEQFMQVAGRYPYPGPQIEPLLQKHCVQYIVTTRRELTHYLNRICEDCSRFEELTTVVNECDAFLVLIVKRALLSSKLTCTPVALPAAK